MKPSIHIAYILLSFFAILVLFRIAATEIQPWDEGLFAMRAKSIIEYGCIWDQSHYSPGGLYSATYPPLTVWVMASSMKLFGTSSFAVRFFSAICSIAAIFVFFAVARRFLTDEKSLAASLLLSGTIIWNTYSRQGMTDVPLNFFILLSFFATLKLHVEEDKKKTLLWSSLFALSFGLALMTKIVVSFLPLLFVLLFLLKTNDLRKKKLIGIASLLGLMIAAPWHIYMIKIHGWEFLRAFLAPHLVSAVENNESHIGWGYYINQMIISNPALVLGFCSLYFYIRYRRKLSSSLENSEKYMFITLFSWFLVGFVIFTIAPTKVSHYSLYILFPALLLSVKFYSQRNLLIQNPRELWFLFTILLISSLWSFGWILRQDIKNIANHQFSPYTMSFLIIILALVLVGILVRKSELEKLANSLLPGFSQVLILLILLRLVFFNAFVPNGEIAGGMKTAYILEEVDGKSFVYLYNEHNGSDSLNPQLAWYSKGWLTGWRKGKSFRPVPVPENRINYKSLRKLDRFPGEIVVYYMPQNIYLAQAAARDILETRPLLEQTGRYLIFGMKRWDRRKGKIL